MKVLPAAVCVISLLLTGCDQNRYELGKDASGNTVRLDRRTGEMAIIKGDQIRSLKDAAQADAERKAWLAELEKFKSWEHQDVTNIGVRALLSTSWRDGKLYYSLNLGSLEVAKAMQAWLETPKDKRGDRPKANPKQRSASLEKAVSYRPFVVELNDQYDFRIATINVAALIRVVDENGLASSYEEKGSLVMSEDDYRRISDWDFRWRVSRP